MALILNSGLPVGSRGLWWFAQGLENLGTAATGDAALSGATLTGGAVVHDATADMTTLASNPALLAPTTAVTIMLDLRCTDTTLRGMTAFGLNDSSFSEVCGAHLPYSDGTIYWDFGGVTTGTNRLTFAWTKDTTQHIWAFTAGARGMEIWRDGTKVASHAGTPTRGVNTTQPYRLGRHLGGLSDLYEYRWVFMHETQLSEALIAAISADPEGELTEGGPILLAGSLAFALTLTGTLVVPALLAGTVTFSLTLTGALDTGGGATFSGTLAFTLTLAGTLSSTQALLAGRLRFMLLLRGALEQFPELRALRSEQIQRPVGHVELEGGAPVPHVLRFSLDSSLDTPSDGWTAEVAGAELMLTPDDEALYRLPVGFLDATDSEVLAAHITSGRILDRRLVGRADERRTYVRGLDALDRTFRLQRRVRYIPEDGEVAVLSSIQSVLQPALSGRKAELQLIAGDPELETYASHLSGVIVQLEMSIHAANEAVVLEKVGTWTASAIAADLCVGTGLTVSWETRDYTFATPFEAVGPLYDLLQRLAEPWSQVRPFTVDIWAVGTVIRVRHRLLSPPPDVTMSVAASRLVDLDLGDRRRLPRIGLVELEGRLDAAGSDFYSGRAVPGLGEPVLPVLPWDMAVQYRERTGNGSVYGTRTYRMPDKILIAQDEWVDELIPGYGYWLTKHESSTFTYEDTHYGPQGPLSQPLPLSAHKELETLRKVPGSGELILTLTSKEDTTWEYDDRRFLRVKSTQRYQRSETGEIIGYPLVESIVETWNALAEGWYQLLTTRTTFDPKTGNYTSATTQHPQDQAGYPPGGPRQPFSFATFISAPSREASEPGAPIPVQLVETISTDPTAVAFRYSNPNLTHADLEFIRDQCREASGLVEYPLRGRGPALPDILKGTAVHLTDYVDAEGTPIPLDPALVRGITFDYVDGRDGGGFTCAIDCVFYRRED